MVAWPFCSTYQFYMRLYNRSSLKILMVRKIKMAIPFISLDIKDQIIGLLESTSRIIDLDVCFYTYAYRDLIPYPLQIHSDPICMRIKEHHADECIAHCGSGIPQRIFEFEKGKVDTCPFGCSQIIIPVSDDDHLLGVIFAGVFRLENTLPSQADIPIVRSPQWIQDRKNTIFMLAKALANLFSMAHSHAVPSIKQKIMKYVMKDMSQPKMLEELAAFIQKSPSRTSHLVREYFGCSFQHLVTDIRINRAMAMLTQTNYSVAHIAMELGFSDQSHFTHSFKKWISVTPLAYRKKHGNI